ncbi:hypothetical protein EHQ59_09495 [Leptospira kemamanensis]|uniref:DUF1795 domain-containing protein n=1 Tax=Leptospira kemamanensis TaxID=2484942 RepID=A0A4R9JR64_9LEPT|nr:hypothetical protein [Leptospira kemamanensis]TGL52278.1 hypothetical protein EHQ59_09495 [Leptospira kemamanensis]
MKTIYLMITMSVIATVLYASPTKTVEFKSLGLSIEKPDSWEEVTNDEFSDNKNRLQLKTKTFTKILHENKELPLYSMRKGNPETDEYLTMINIKAQSSDLEFNNIPYDLRILLSRMSYVLKKFEYILEPKVVRINGNLAGYAVFTYKLLDEDNQEFQVVSAIWIFPRKDFFYLVGSSFVSEDFEPTLNEIKQIVSTLKITK